MLDHLVVIPSDPLAAYEQKGILDRLETYFNPAQVAKQVTIVSPYEPGDYRLFNYTVRHVPFSKLKSFLNEVKPDLLRAYGGYWACDWAMANRPKNLPVVVSVHDTKAALLHSSISLATDVIGVSSAVATLVQQRGVLADHIHQIPNWIAERFSPQTKNSLMAELDGRYRLDKGIKILLSIGRLTEQKNTANTIRTLTELPQDYHLICVGQGDVAAYQKVAVVAGVAERCHFVSAVKNSDLPTWYSWADIMFTPSRWEGFGIVFAEAAACGACIVSSDIAPLNEYFTNNESALLVADYENPVALAKAVQHVSTDQKLEKKLRQQAKQVATQFSRLHVQQQEREVMLQAAAKLVATSPLSQMPYQLQLQAKALVRNFIHGKTPYPSTGIPL